MSSLVNLTNHVLKNISATINRLNGADDVQSTVWGIGSLTSFSLV